MRLRHQSSFATLALIMLAAPVVTHAQTPDANHVDGKAKEDQAPLASEIVVTATKQNLTLSDVPAAVSAITSSQLRPGGIQDIGDLQTVTPNVSIGNQFGVNRTFIRGVGLTSFDIGGEGSVAFLQDGAILARPSEQLSGFFDLAQIEILRGPQSILYGRGATAGAINLVTAKPTDELAGYLRATYGNYNSKIVEAAFGGPISGDSLLVRLAGKYEKHDGYGTNLFTGQPVDNRDAYALRATVVAKFNPDVKLTLVGDHSHEDDNNYSFHYFGPTVVPNDMLPAKLIGGQTIFDYYNSIGQAPNLRNIYSDQEGLNHRNGSGVTGTIDVGLGDVSIKSITAYRSFDRFQRDDLDVSNVNMFGQNNYVEKSRSFSQEITANYNKGRWSLVGGAMYFHEKLIGQVLVPLTNLGVLFGLPADTFNNGAYEQNGTVRINAVGAYLQASYELTPTLKLTAGARYNYEHRAGVGYFKFDALGVNIPTDKAKGWSSVTPKLLLEFKPVPGTMVYASVTKGFKSGVINVGSLDAAINPETVWSYEAGFKQKLLNDQMLLSGAAFYYDYSNLQVSFVNANSIVETINAATARNYGAELELEGKLARNFSVNLAASYLNARFTQFCNAYYGAAYPPRAGIAYPSCPTDPALADLSGKRLPNAPSFTLGGGFNLDIPIAGDGRISLSGDGKYQTKVYFSEFNNRDAEQDAYAIFNAGLTYHSPGDKYSLGVWVKNLTDKYVIANNIITAALYSYVRVGSLMPPRTYGVTAAINF